MSTHNPHQPSPQSSHPEDPLKEALGVDDSSAQGSQSAGYELSDANTSAITAFLAVLVASLAVFFVFCFALGKLINHELIKHDGPANRWVKLDGRNLTPAQREMIVSNAAGEQEQLSIMTKKFPNPRLQLDDGNQDTADLHSKEDLLLENYTYVDQGSGTVRIPIDRAMELIAQRGLPVIAGTPTEGIAQHGTASLSSIPNGNLSKGHLAGVEPVTVSSPLTDGFARTGWEQEVAEERHQRLESREAMKEQR